jgi:hypothetical protein
MTNDGQQPDGNQPQESKLAKDAPEIRLSVPWDERVSQVARGHFWNNNSMDINVDLDDSSGVHNNFIVERTRLHETYIREQARNKRIGLILSFILILAAALIVMFAPKDREKMSYWVGASLVIFAAGAGGFGRVWGKAANISFGADQDRRQL